MKRFFAMCAVLTMVGCSAAPRKFSGPVIDEAAKIEKVAGGYKFTEGPAADKDGHVVFSDIPNNKIIRFDVATGMASIAVEESGGANGLMYDKDGSLIICEGGARRITRLKDGKATILAANYMGDRLNSPNDLDIDAKGGVYFTDPRYGDRASMEMQIEGVYYITPAGVLTRVLDDLKRPNGVILALDGKTLYVSDHGAAAIYAYDVKPDGSLAGKRVFFDLNTLDRKGGVDGMTIDEWGHIYGAAQGRIYVWDPMGKLVKSLDFPEGPANCAFGGKDRKTLYVTARTSLYRVTTNVRGGK